jgi:gas vesicle protein
MSDQQGFFPYAGAFILGSIVGALAGALVGVFLAPKAGVDTQADLRKRMRDIRDQADDILSRSRESVESSLTSGGKLVDSARSRIAEEMEQTASTISDHAKNIRPDNKTTAG